ncbi:MAG: beta-ketoacyl-ACP synthase I [Francisellaceae bacterium]|jgi:3-oxoacyl-[acyl-carrier-protein] synthase I|nr:beta-ketoacyl-ACP synthase I [Francisellaceae bacterium]
MKRVVITGIGIISSIGNNKEEVLTSLQNSKSGIVYKQELKDKGFRSCVNGAINIDTSSIIDRRELRFMGQAAAYAQIAMMQAVADSGLDKDKVSNDRTGLLVGSGGASNSDIVESYDILKKSGSTKRLGPYRVPRTMSSTTSACLATNFEIKGVTYSISSACASSAHCVGAAMEQIQLGKQDIMFAGGGEELHWSLSMLFDGMGALSSQYNDAPTTASRPFDTGRDGFVITGGGAIVVLEGYEHAKARGAKIYGEIVGYGATADGYNMVQPSGEGAVRCMRQALQQVDKVDYVNAHGTSTPIGDLKEVDALHEVFGSNMPVVSSTKSLTGHSLGAAGAQELIYSILMLEQNFACGTLNLEKPIDNASDSKRFINENTSMEINAVMSNSFGFGGVNASLVVKKV